MAIGTRMAKARFNGGEFKPISNRVYGVLGDGCIMEGVTAEAASLAGHLGLGELIFLYDDNEITIDGSTDITMSENVELRYKAYGWHTLRVDGHDQAAVKAAIIEAQGHNRQAVFDLGANSYWFREPESPGHLQSAWRAFGERRGVAHPSAAWI